MKRLKILGLSLLALFALSAIAANVALGEEGVLTPQTFTINGKVQKLENLNKEKIECTSVEGTGTPLTGSDTHSTGHLHFLGCKALGFAASTLGDGSGEILVNVLYLICLINSASLQWGVLVEPTEGPVHIEVPSLKALILVKGAIIGEFLTAEKGKFLEGQPEGKAFTVDFLPEDTTTRLKCSLTGLGPWTANYEASIDTKADLDAWQEGESVTTFAAAVKFMDA
jgi:hypothetical protein